MAVNMMNVIGLTLLGYAILVMTVVQAAVGQSVSGRLIDVYCGTISVASGLRVVHNQECLDRDEHRKNRLGILDDDTRRIIRLSRAQEIVAEHWRSELVKGEVHVKIKNGKIIRDPWDHMRFPKEQEPKYGTH